MSVLDRYLARLNLLYLTLTLALGTGIYLLSDIFDRLDEFVENRIPAGVVLEYFLAKIPLVISQTLPAVFLIALVIQLSLMARSRELLALESGGVSPWRLARFFLAAGLVWGLVQIVFSQAVGAAGMRQAESIWAEQVRKRQVSRQVLRDVWFREGAYFVHLDEVRPAQGEGTGLTVYEFEQTGDGQEGGAIGRIILAGAFRAGDRGWTLIDARVTSTASFETGLDQTLELPLKQDLQAFVAVDPKTDPASLPLWRLGQTIGQLQAAGSNVERLQTAWHMKVAYGFSLAVMSLLALALISLGHGVYVNVGLSLGVTFVYYAVFTLGVSAGQKGMLPPALGAWAGNLLFGTAAAARLVARWRPVGRARG